MPTHEHRCPLRRCSTLTPRLAPGAAVVRPITPAAPISRWPFSGLPEDKRAGHERVLHVLPARGRHRGLGHLPPDEKRALLAAWRDVVAARRSADAGCRRAAPAARRRSSTR